MESIMEQVPYLENRIEKETQNFWKALRLNNSIETLTILHFLCQSGFYEKNGIYSWHDFIYNCVINDRLNDLEDYRFSFQWNNPINEIFWQRPLYYDDFFHCCSSNAMNQRYWDEFIN